jgi:hypothetical protein
MVVLLVHGGSSSLTALQIAAMVADKPGVTQFF